MTSSALPTAWPSGVIHVADGGRRASARACVPMATIDPPARASASRFMKAPSPAFTSSRITSLPSASFFDITLAEISGMLPTVAVTSRSA